jgi:hypothetical protein
MTGSVRHAMKKALPYEIAAAILALLGAGILVGVYFPLLNPGMHKVETGRAGEPLSYYLALTPIPLLILIASWRFNKKARAIKQQSEQSLRVPQPAWQSRLKWILAAIVILVVLIAFLW